MCEPECPVDAIKLDTEDDPDGKWLALNTKFANIWTNITIRKDVPADAGDFTSISGKLDKFLVSNLGLVMPEVE